VSAPRQIWVGSRSDACDGRITLTCRFSGRCRVVVNEFAHYVIKGCRAVWCSPYVRIAKTPPGGVGRIFFLILHGSTVRIPGPKLDARSQAYLAEQMP
jgi:hypothetical protein